MNFFYFLLFLFSFSFLSLSGEENKKVLAILDIEAKSGVREEIAEFVSERIRVEFFKSGSYKIVERQKINKVLEEQKLSLISSDEDGYISKVGNLLSADEILVGTLSYIEGNYYLNVRVIDVKSGEMIFGETEKASSVSELSYSAERIAAKISGKHRGAKDEGKGDFQPPLSVDIDRFKISDIKEMVRSVVEYSIRKAEELKKLKGEEKILDGTEGDKKTEINDKDEVKIDEKHGERFVKFGGGLLLKYHFNMGFMSPTGERTYLLYPFTYGATGVFNFGNVFGIGVAGNIGGSYQEIGDKEYIFGFGYLGVTFDVSYRLWNFLRLGINMMVGYGTANSYIFYSTDTSNYNYYEPLYEKRKNFFVFEPGVLIGVKIFNAFEIGITGSYFYTSHQQDFFWINNYNIGAHIIFGL